MTSIEQTKRVVTPSVLNWHRPVGKQVPHQAGLELTSGGDDLLRRLLRPLHGSEDVGDGTLLRERWKGHLKRAIWSY